jgi:hypothetical protein
VERLLTHLPMRCRSRAPIGSMLPLPPAVSLQHPAGGSSSLHARSSSPACHEAGLLAFARSSMGAEHPAGEYDKLIESFAAFVLLACIRIWIRFVHTTSLVNSPPPASRQLQQRFRLAQLKGALSSLYPRSFLNQTSPCIDLHCPIQLNQIASAVY